MRAFIIFLLTTIIFLVLKSTLMPTLPLPDLPLIITFYIASRRPSVEGVILCFIIGYFDDALSGGIMGMTSFSLLFVYAATYVLARKVDFSNNLSKAVGGGAASLLKGILTFIVWSNITPGVSFFMHVVPVVIVTAVFTPLIFSLFTRFRVLRKVSDSAGELF